MDLKSLDLHSPSSVSELDLGFPLSFSLQIGHAELWILDLGFPLCTVRCAQPSRILDSGFGRALELKVCMRSPNWILDSGFELDFDLTRSQLRTGGLEIS